MSTYRDDLEAALARNADLERRVRELEGSAARSAAPAPIVSYPWSRAAATTTEIGSLVAEREDTQRSEQSRRQRDHERARAKSIARLARRSSRLSIECRPDRARITIARKPVRDALASQVEAILFAAVNPGIFVVIGLSMVFAAIGLSVGTAVALAIPAWLALLMAISLVYARLAHRPHYLDLAADGTFALHRGNPRSALLLGRTAKLETRLQESPDPACLHDARFTYEGTSIELDALLDRDITGLRRVLAQVRS